MRPGLIVFITIPLVLAVTFIGMNYWGIGLHKISLGSLIIALGLLVDDAIIAVERMVRKIEEGYEKVRAAAFAYEITAMPLLTGTLIMAAGFLPIGIARSVTVNTRLRFLPSRCWPWGVSWLVSVYIVPYLGTLLLNPPAQLRDQPTGAVAGTAVMPVDEASRGMRSAEPHESFDSLFYNGFRRLLQWCLRASLDHDRHDVADICHGHCHRGGLVVATVLTLLALPALYAAWLRVPKAPANTR